jgi:Flp pilus assembly protein TadG
MIGRRLFRDSKGSASVEFAVAVPVLISLIWGIFQISLLFQAGAGVQNALGQAARYATIYPTPSDTAIKALIESSKFGTSNGNWSTPTITTDASGYKVITVSYSQPTDFLFFAGPTVTLTKTKRVYLQV